MFRALPAYLRGVRAAPALACRRQPQWPTLLLERTLVAERKGRKLPPSVIVAESASARLAALLSTNSGAAGLRIGMTNDWGSVTGFTYTLDFVHEGQQEESDERIDLDSGATLYVDRKALWAGEGGLLGAVLDMDDDFNLVITPKPPKE